MVPAGSEFFVNPRRISAFGAPASIIHSTGFPSDPFTSIVIQGCGLIHSIFVTVPSSRTGRLASNSAENEWWADSVAVHASAMPASVTTNLRMIVLLFPNDDCLEPSYASWLSYGHLR